MVSNMAINQSINMVSNMAINQLINQPNNQYKTKQTSTFYSIDQSVNNFFHLLINKF